MKLQVLLLLICMLYTKALALTCYKCLLDEGGDCDEGIVTNCPDLCVSRTTAVYWRRPVTNKPNVQNCSTAQQCITGTVNYGTASFYINSKCCKTDYCNSQKLPALTKGSPNGKRCYYCEGTDCSKTVSCNGDEDRCFTARDVSDKVKKTVKGCVSRSFCTPAAYGFKRAGISGTVKCCKGKLCNKK